ncbi:hypothetical protein WM40_23380 [Robbsia andropogonis]|uniref:DUF4148 domain-containing protein n=1 Tax=Robbsia andropogonis TaxID=28092 RepID=A0A0F5JVV1_9BURK|nr:DUF4148 domain-containing protein [Robbsia andropogonis]KKB61412.1 hypothetical protein WM40_23380 [Robbsia andropogonis]MCP1119510.1 DUF4148 domain-containing protein [Robbsia andropogonis]MCP1129493.1 DUF4148 domain-containing protein [Robbsia andropogonis]
MNTKFLPIVTIAAALAVPVFAHAQSANGPVTRAEVKSELSQLESAGYNPGADRANYPVDLQRAERRINFGGSNVSNSSGSSVSGSSDSAPGRNNSNSQGWNPNPVDNHPGA